MSDLISRQAAIDEIEERKNANGYRNVAAISELNRLEGYIMRLPSAQSEIIHCGECRHRDPEDHKCDCGHDIIWQLPRDDKWYCADAERRTDEQDSE